MVDATTQAALEAPVLYWRVLIYADFQDDVLRGCSGLYPKTISGSGDSELDGTYDPYDERMISVGAVGQNETGSDTVTVSLNGILAGTEYIADRDGIFIQDRNDEYISIRISSFLNLVGDKARWQGRTARLWFYCVDEDENQVGSIIPYYTGYMNEISIGGSAQQQLVSLTIENYIASLSGAQNKNYLSQDKYDSGDLSGEAAIAAANGTKGAGLSDFSTAGGVFVAGVGYIPNSGGLNI